jgi:hypothetical protein
MSKEEMKRVFGELKPKNPDRIVWSRENQRFEPVSQFNRILENEH